MINRTRSFFIAAVILAAFLPTSIPAFAAATTPKTTVTKKAASPKVARRLDGVWVPKSQANKRVQAAMIDNHSAARPQAGLREASIVYEALAEGGIPRFMALYPNTRMGNIGPIRSARPYYVQFAAEHQAAVIHAGGSPDAQNLLKKIGLRNIEGLKDPTARYFFRQGYGVHSLFTNGTQLTKANARYKTVAPTYKSWKYVSQPPKSKRKTGRHGARVDLGAGWRYAIAYDYDRNSNTYFRSTGNKPHLDKKTRRQIAINNVILQFVAKERVIDRQGRINLQVVGSGKAILLKNGTATTVNWKKSSSKGRTTYTNAKGTEITLNRGSTWITIVPRGKKYSIF